MVPLRVLLFTVAYRFTCPCPATKSFAYPIPDTVYLSCSTDTKLMSSPRLYVICCVAPESAYYSLD
jgi:hypothetical protein